LKNRDIFIWNAAANFTSSSSSASSSGSASQSQSAPILLPSCTTIAQDVFSVIFFFNLCSKRS
jgi:hypothetical protein